MREYVARRFHHLRYTCSATRPLSSRVYTMYTMYTIYTQLPRLTTSLTWQLLGLCSGAAVVASALLGGLVFRPDNSAVLELVAPVSRPIRTRHPVT